MIFGIRGDILGVIFGIRGDILGVHFRRGDILEILFFLVKCSSFLKRLGQKFYIAWKTPVRSDL